MNLKSVAYLNRLNVVSFVLVHRQILEQTRKISSSSVVPLAESYARLLAEMENVVQVPASREDSLFAKKLFSAYNACRKAVASLTVSSSTEYGTVIETLALAFGKSIYHKSNDHLSSILNAAEQLASTVSSKELDAFALRERVENFVKLNKNYRQSKDARKRNKSVRSKGVFWIYRDCCNEVYRCIVKVAENLSYRGDAKCKNFIAWLKG